MRKDKKKKKYPLIERKRKYKNRNDQEWVEEEDEYEDSIIVVQIDARIDKKKQTDENVCHG